MTETISAASFARLALMLVSQGRTDNAWRGPGSHVELATTKQQLALRTICVESMGDQDANAKD